MILLFGPAGSGKSAQAELLINNYGWCWLSVGQLLRDTDDEEIHEYQRKGVLVPAEKMNRILGEALQKEQSTKKLILDGYPRNIEQAEWLIDRCQELDIKIDCIINLNVHIEELLKRMELRGRDDDNPEAIKERLAIYNRESSSIFRLLEKSVGVKTSQIDGVGTFEEVHERIVKELKRCRLE